MQLINLSVLGSIFIHWKVKIFGLNVGTREFSAFVEIVEILDTLSTNVPPLIIWLERLLMNNCGRLGSVVVSDDRDPMFNAHTSLGLHPSSGEEKFSNLSVTNSAMHVDLGA